MLIFRIFSENFSMNQSAIEIFKTEDGATEIRVVLEKDTVWLNLNQLSFLFERDKSVISMHIGNIFKEQELESSSTVANFATVQIEGERTVERTIEFFNLDVIISVRYRVNSKRGTQFRVWANKILKDYLVSGFALNKRKLLQQNEQLKEFNSKYLLNGNQQAA